MRRRGSTLGKCGQDKRKEKTVTWKQKRYFTKEDEIIK